MLSKYWNFTSCIHSSSRNQIRSAIIDLLEQEQGCRVLPNLPYLVLNTEKIKQLNILERNPLLIVALGIGREGWTIIKTYPNDWFFLRTPDGVRPRLSALAMQLKCDAFHYRVINDVEGLLVEADSNGEFRFDSTEQPHFSLIEVSKSLNEVMQINQSAELIKIKAEYQTEFERQRARGEFDLQLLASMSDKFQEGDAERIDVALAKLIDPFQAYWQIYDLFEQVYNNFQHLNEMDVKFLCFKPPNNYLRTLPSYYEQPEEY